MADTSREPRRFTGRHMLIVTLSFFGVIIAVNMVLAWFATGTWTGLVVKNTYVASQDFNRTVEAARDSAGAGWTVRLQREADALVLGWTGSDGQPIRGLAVDAVAGRTVHENADRRLTFREMADGSYRADATLSPGAWQLVVVTTDPAGAEVRRILRFTVPEARQ
ncbi:MAG: FixH family protein [Pseudomonadota bacterium]|nr:FixH family protein [Pseudomonadota bacterium]